MGGWKDKGFSIDDIAGKLADETLPSNIGDPGVGSAPNGPLLPEKPPVDASQWLPGVDVSNNNPGINWMRVSVAGKRFAIAKASGDETASNQFFDQDFADNWASIKGAGMTRGAYHYAKPSRVSPAKSVTTFEEALRRVGGLQPGDLVALDMEDPDVPSGTSLAQWTAEWLDLARTVLGVTPIIYTGNYYIRDHNLVGLDAYPLWLASYQDTLPPAPTEWPISQFKFWQYSQDGQVPGIGKALEDWFLGTADDLRQLGFSPGVITLPPEPTDPVVSLQDRTWALAEEWRREGWPWVEQGLKAIVALQKGDK